MLNELQNEDAPQEYCSSENTGGVLKENLPQNIQTKKKNQPSMVIKSVNQDYEGMLQGYKDPIHASNYFETLSDLSFRSSISNSKTTYPYWTPNDEPFESNQTSESCKLQYSQSSSEKFKVTTEECCVSEPKSPRFEIGKDWNRPFCRHCQAYTPTRVGFKLRSMSFWNSVRFFFQAMRCCGNPALNSYQKAFHVCKNCGNEISGSLSIYLN